MPSRACPAWLEGNGNDCYAGYVRNNKQHHRKVLPSSFYVKGHTLGFHPQTQRVEQPCNKIINSTTGKYCSVAFILMVTIYNALLDSNFVSRRIRVGLRTQTTDKTNGLSLPVGRQNNTLFFLQCNGLTIH